MASPPKHLRLTANSLLRAYMIGLFPMAEHTDSKELFWVDPDMRGVLLLRDFHLSRSVRKLIRQEKFTLSYNHDFRAVMEACRQKTKARPDSWINDDILRLYCELHKIGYAHSVEVWDATNERKKLVGGIYGVAIGAAFFGESMFSFADNASKVALTYLAARLIFGGYYFLDTQFISHHLRQFGVIEVPRGRYHSYLQDALDIKGDFHSLPADASPDAVLQVIDHKS